MNSISNSTHEETNDFSETNIDDVESKKISDEAKERYEEIEFEEKVKAYIKIDNLIRKIQDDIKELKNKRKPCENYILNYLLKSENSFVSLSSGKLIKNESQTKAPLKIDFIKEAIREKIKCENLFDTEDKYNAFVESVLELMDKKRPIKKRVNLKRTFQKDKQPKTIKNNANSGKPLK
ncbi:hypothetical protein Catovirus_1_1082 [Catovirus CTV1]|uniref:Uncharacterized protein n=1 Tax=Catovirus CTV1 TaxID=1977631 RepID=A0A1V0SBF2_9VIRU|nr:hypothetical protein Catovirus_1_1082 [Catovirus CTV1]